MFSRFYTMPAYDGLRDGPTELLHQRRALHPRIDTDER